MTGSAQRQLESDWRQRLQRSHDRYLREAQALTEAVAESPSQVWRHDPDGRLLVRQALHRESDALREYMRVVRIYSDLVLYGIRPQEEA